MRLLHSTELTLQYFIDPVPQYAILSHTWEVDEVSLQDIEKGSHLPKHGWQKILDCCRRARQDGWDWVWVDTCCIDKTSSAELSEAINSMFAWYRDAVICYAYLADVESNSEDTMKQFSACKWLTRGWTLQELIAPPFLTFLDRKWNELGTREQLSDALYMFTGISAEDMVNYPNCCVAQKMAWASRRKTTRLEDEAYCLLGLFNVNMPLIYGEGRKSFIRLQEEILKTTEDSTIFAWASEKPLNELATSSKKMETTSVLASSPFAFHTSSNVRRYKNISKFNKIGCNFTYGKGAVQFQTTVFSPVSTSPCSFALLDCGRLKEGFYDDLEKNSLLALLLVPTPGDSTTHRRVVSSTGLVDILDDQDSGLRVHWSGLRRLRDRRSKMDKGLSYVRKIEDISIGANDPKPISTVSTLELTIVSPPNLRLGFPGDEAGAKSPSERPTSWIIPPWETPGLALRSPTLRTVVVDIQLRCPCGKHPAAFVVFAVNVRPLVACHAWSSELKNTISNEPAKALEFLVNNLNKGFIHECGTLHVELVPARTKAASRAYKVMLSWKPFE